MYSYRDPALRRLCVEIGRCIVGDRIDRDEVREQLFDLAAANSKPVAAYWSRTERGRGVPDQAFKLSDLYLFSDEPPARIFSTSGTTGQARGRAAYSARGLELMDHSILENARRHIVGDIERPAIVRLVPQERARPEMIMAYGMERIASEFGDPNLSACVIGPRGLDLEQLLATLDRACAMHHPVLLIGGSFAFVNVCDQLAEQGASFELPPGSRAVDAGGFKTQSRSVDVDTLKQTFGKLFALKPDRCINLFGMTELASQLYDASDESVGPLGERPKERLDFVEPRVLDPMTLEVRRAGLGLLEVVDLCVIDRPCSVLTGDLAVAVETGVAIAGRAHRGESRGCSLTLDGLTRSRSHG